MTTLSRTTTRHLAAGLALAAGLTGCAAMTPQAAAPQASVAPSLQLISQDERQAYIAGFIAGRHYQAKQDHPAAPAAAPAAPAPATPAPIAATPAPANCPPDPPPPGGALPPGVTDPGPRYNANGTAQPVKGASLPF
jgi:hypothetical protein